MRSLLFVLLAACGGGTKSTVSQPPPPPPAAGSASEPMVAAPMSRPTCGDDVVKCTVDTFAFFTEEACTCKDKACAERVNKEMTDWGMEMAQSPQKDIKPDQTVTRRMTELAEKYGKCLTKLYTDDKPADPCGADPCGG